MTALSSRPIPVSAVVADFEHSVLASRMNSCIRKSSFRPAGAEAGAAEEQVDFPALLAAADPAAGEKVFGKCKSCHKLDGSKGTGPHLDGVMGRPVASVADFAYSDGMKAHGGNWDPEPLQVFLTDPKGVVPGTKMSFAGLKKPEDRANLIAYLQTVN